MALMPPRASSAKGTVVRPLNSRRSTKLRASEARHYRRLACREQTSFVRALLRRNAGSSAAPTALALGRLRAALHGSSYCPGRLRHARAQFLAAGHADFDSSEHLLLSALLQVPMGGSLGGSTAAGGLSLRGGF
jgi:hypothetical protein